MSIFHPHSDLIDSVGANVVRARYGLSPQALHNWRMRGIPVVRRLSFSALAAEKNVALPSDFIAVLAA